MKSWLNLSWPQMALGRADGAVDVDARLQSLIFIQDRDPVREAARWEARRDQWRVEMLPASSAGELVSQIENLTVGQLESCALVRLVLAARGPNDCERLVAGSEANATTDDRHDPRDEDVRSTIHFDPFDENWSA